MPSDWEEVKKLAADFQRTQAASSLQRLSERNCIDVVKKLVQLSLIEVIFTCDGKEYVTPAHLLREIEDELAINGGRVHLTDLSSNLNIDYSHIENKATELSNDSDGQIALVLGQLISNEYKDRIAQEINVRLEQEGVTNIAELTKQYDLPADFIEEVIDERLGTSIHGVKDPGDRRTIFTESYVNQYKSRLRGILTAVTRPTSIPSILTRFKFPEKISWSAIESLVKEGELSGTINSSSKVYTPSIFLKSQKDFVENFYRQNSYLEYDTLSKIGISDSKTYCSSKFPDLIPLKSCAVSKNLLYQLDSSIEEGIASGVVVDISSVLPSILNPDDVELFVEKCVAGNKGIQECSLFCSAIIVPNAILSSLKIKIEEKMNGKALQDFKDGKLTSYFGSKQATLVAASAEEGSKLSKKEERKKKAAGKTSTGGGTQGREIKIKSTKKKYKPGQKRDDFDSDDESGTTGDSLIFMTIQELTEEIKKLNSELDETHPDLTEEIASKMSGDLNAQYLEVARKVYLENEKASNAGKKKTHAELQASLSSLHSSISLYEKGLQSVADENLRSQLLKYLQKSLVTDAVNTLITSVSTESNPNLSNPDSRNKVIGKLDSVQKESLSKLASFTNSTSLDGFLESLEQSAGVNEMFIKPVDKKREKTLLSENRQNLLTQLQETEDPGLTLHVTILILYQTITGSAIHASGKFVPNIIQEFKGKLPEDTFNLLTEFEQLVIKQVKSGRDGESGEEQDSLVQKLQELQPRIKELGISFKP